MLDLENTFYVPSFSRNLDSVSRLVKIRVSFLFGNSKLVFLKIKLLFAMTLWLMVYTNFDLTPLMNAIIQIFRVK